MSWGKWGPTQDAERDPNRTHGKVCTAVRSRPSVPPAHTVSGWGLWSRDRRWQKLPSGCSWAEMGMR